MNPVPTSPLDDDITTAPLGPVDDTMVRDSVLYPNKRYWAAQICNLLNEIGFSEAWLNQSVGDEKTFLLLLQQRLKDIYTQGYGAFNSLQEPCFI